MKNSMTDYEKAISFGNLYQGFRMSRRGVMWKNSVAGYSMNALENTWKLRQDLINGSYEISEYQRFTIYEPKEREIIATRIRDRQFQRSLCDNVLYPQITKGFIYDNCACLKGKGITFALNRMKCHMQQYYRKHGTEGWVLKCDIRHYFPETPHETAKAALRKRIQDPDALKAAEHIIDSFGGDRGIGLGSQVSQLVELAVLDDLDHYIKERLRIRHYIRYMDDFILIHEDREVLENALKEIRKRAEALGLALNRKTQIAPLKHGIRFLKWRHILTKTGRVILRADKRSYRREEKRLRELAEKVKAGRIPIAVMANSYQSWDAHMARGQTGWLRWKIKKLYRQMEGEIKDGAEDKRDDESGRAADKGSGQSGGGGEPLRETGGPAGDESGGG